MKEKLIHKMRGNDTIRLVLSILFLIVPTYAVIQMFFNSEFSGVFLRLRFFTNLANILAFTSVLLFTLKLDKKKFYKYFSLATLIAILMTGLIYHALLSDGNMDFNNHVTHTFTPIVYLLFYYLMVKGGIKLKKVWVSLVFPLTYFIVILIQGAFTNWYPYGFLNPTLEGASIVSVLVFCCLILLPIIAVFTLLLVLIKNNLEKFINNKL